MKAKKLLAVLCTVLALIVCFAFVACDSEKPGTTEKTEYTVTFDANGGELNGNATVKVESGKTITGAPTASKADHDFKGWYTLAVDGDEVKLDTYKVTADVKLYAHYTAKQTPPVEKIWVTFDANGGTLTGENKMEVDENGNILELPEATREGYRFDAWYDAKEGGNAVDPMFDTIEESVTLYAHWIKTYKVTFDANGGTLEGQDIIVVDENGKISGAPTATKAGEEFHGWYTAAEGGNAVDFATLEITADMTFYAHFGVLSMPIKNLKNHEGNKVGYRIEAEDSKIEGTQSSENQTGDGFIEFNIETASGNKSIGYLGVAGNTITFTFKSDAAGKANISVRATSNNMQMDSSDGGFVMWVEDQTVTTADFTAKFNGAAVNFAPATLRGAGKEMPSVWNLYWDPIPLGNLDVKQGVNELVLTVAAQTVPNMDCLDIETTLNITSANGNAASGDATLPAPTTPPAADNAYNKTVDINLVVGGYEGGPAIEKAILGFAEDIPATAVATKNPFTVSLGQPLGSKDDKVYLCDENGAKVTAATSRYVAIEYAISYGQWSFNGNLSPFQYTGSKNVWKDLTKATLAVKDLAIGDKVYTKFEGTVTSDKEVPCLENWDLTGSYSKEITWNNEERTIELKYGAYAPATLKEDNGKNALIVWLHGGGEGGTDPSIAILGNQVTGLSNETVQKYFKQGGLNGAYVLAPQSPTQWMDIGDGAQASSPEDSVYTETLFNLIKKYAEELNDDVDLNRIYIGGCSNGGWMTLELLADHGEYFAAAYPVSACYDTQYISEAMISKLKNIPIWFTHSKNDGTLPIAEKNQSANWWEPATFGALLNQNTNEVYLKLLAAGATNVHYSLFETVTVGQTNYDGHWSWIYTFRDECKYVQPSTGTTTLEDLNTASTATVKLSEGGEDVTMWGWIAAQAKTPAQA